MALSGPRPPEPAVHPRLRLNVAYGSWELVWSHVHRVLVVNLGMAVTNLPLLVALQVCHRPWQYPLFFGPLALLTGPSVAAAFACLDGAGTDGQAPLRGFLRAYVRLFRPALRISAPVLLAVTAAVADVVALRMTAVGPALVPMAVVVAVLAASSGIVALAHPAAVVGAGWKAFVVVPYAVVRHWPLSLLNLVLTAVGLLAVNQAPLLGMVVLPGCVLFVLWRNCQSPHGLFPHGSARLMNRIQNAPATYGVSKKREEESRCARRTRREDGGGCPSRRRPPWP